jgi:hypothetical protein
VNFIKKRTVQDKKRAFPGKKRVRIARNLSDFAFSSSPQVAFLLGFLNIKPFSSSNRYIQNVSRKTALKKYIETEREENGTQGKQFDEKRSY